MTCLSNHEQDLSLTVFKNASLPVVVITTATSWDEPPRIRHQMANLLVENFNVLFVELPFESSWIKKKNLQKVSDRMSIISLGGFFKIIHFLRWKNKFFHLFIDLLVAKYLRRRLVELFGDKKKNIIPSSSICVLCYQLSAHHLSTTIIVSNDFQQVVYFFVRLCDSLLINALLKML